MNNHPTNQQNIHAWSQFPQEEIEKFGDEGDFGRQHLLNPNLLELLGDVKNKAILDAGCGNGYLARKLAKLGAKVTGVEPAESLFQYAAAREKQEPLGITYLQQDLSKFAQPNSLDIVVSNMVFMDIPDWQSAMQNCIDALKSGGQFIFSISHPCFEAVTRNYSVDGYLKIEEYLNEYIVPATYGESYHRTLSTYINFLIDQHIVLDRMIEPQLSKEIAEEFSQHRKNYHIPSYLIISAHKQ